MIECVRVSFAYGDRLAIDDVSLAVRAGELLGVLGPNGSGKSTLLRLMAGGLSPARGEVRLDGRSLGSYRRTEVARRIAATAQENAIEFPFTVAEVVLMGRAPHLGGALFESREDVQVARAAMERCGVVELAGRLIHELSGGERQRVILARAVAQQTPVLVLDEPAAFLDIRHQVEIYDLLRDLQAEGRTIVTVLHDLNLAALYCDRVALLQAGRLIAAGAPEAVITHATITRVYETDVCVQRNAVTGAVTVLPLSRVFRERRRREVPAP